ncbi:unnamed protein product [Spodoptera exigua]|nr:unnamed protein product [Spodoptera exigua]
MTIIIVTFFFIIFFFFYFFFFSSSSLLENECNGNSLQRGENNVNSEKVPMYHLNETFYQQSTTCLY